MIRSGLGVTRMLTVLCCVLALTQTSGLAARRRSHRSRTRSEFRYRCGMIEDAEDGDTAGWTVFDADPPGDPVNVVEPGNETNRVILLKHYETGYRLTLPAMMKRGHIIQWRMKFRTNWYMYVTCLTNMGKLNIRYIPGTVGGRLLDDPVVGLDVPAAQKDWVVIRRNVLSDFRALHPKIKLLGVTDFMARGDGYLDDVYLYDYKDEDGDILPDEYEKDRRLDPKDPRDAKPKHLERVIALSPWCAPGEDAPAEDAQEENPVDRKAVVPGEHGDRSGRPADTDAVPKRRKKKSPELTQEEKRKVKAELQRRYTDCLSELTHPAKGTPCTFRLRSGMVVSGAVEKATHEGISVRDARGTVSFRVARIHPDDVAKLFPKAKAQQMALAELEDIKRAIFNQRWTVRTPAPPAVPEAVDTGPKTGDQAPPESTDPGGSAVKLIPVVEIDLGYLEEEEESHGKITYAPSRAATPASLKPTVAMVGSWLVGYQAEAGFRVARGVHAKWSGSAAVLYVRCHAEFAGKDTSRRLDVSKAIRREWVRCCDELGSVSSDEAHIVMVDDADRIIGGSQPSDASAVWALPY